MTVTPGNHNAITTQLGDQGLGQQPWWVEPVSYTHLTLPTNREV